MIRGLLLTLIFLIYAFAASAQESTDSLISKFNAYRSNVLNEKIFVHTDRSSYLTGETIWFRVYYVDGSLHQPLDLSKVAYIEILDKTKNAVLQSKIVLGKSGGSGSLFLPSSLSSGNYIFRVYTNWMKNFSPDFYFHQSLTIINPFTKLNIESAQAKQQYDVQFFPEGGNLVAGLQNTVAFRAVDRSGVGIDFKGTVVDENNDTLIHFSPLKFGIGRFLFVPKSGKLYRAILVDSKRGRFEYKLPPVLDEGFVIHAHDTLENKLSIVIRSTFSLKQRIYLLGHTRQMLKITETGEMQNGKINFLLDKSLLDEGISHLTLFNEIMIPVCERLVFKIPKEQVSITPIISNEKLGARRKLNVDLKTILGDAPISADMSVAVYKLDSLETIAPSIQEYLWLISDLKGNIESPSWYFEKMQSPERVSAMDNLMLTHGWSRFNWKNVLGNKSVFEHLPEFGGHIVRANLKESDSGKPASRVMTFASVPGKLIRLYVSLSDAKGQIKFEMQDFFGPHQLMIQTNHQLDSNYTIQLVNPFSAERAEFTSPDFTFSKALKRDLEQRSIHMQANNIFFENENNRYRSMTVDSTAFYGKPNEVYNLDDYTRFPTMEEVLREYISGVIVRKNKDGFHFLTKDKTTNVIFTEDPIVLVDGLPVFDADKIMELDPLQIKKLELVTQKYYLGSAIFHGIASYTTYKGDLGGFRPDPVALISKYEGLQLQREFFMPQYETQQARESTVADARTLLFWSPSIQSDEADKMQFSFFTSDIAGKYKIVVQGITKSGMTGYGSTVFEVSEE